MADLPPPVSIHWSRTLVLPAGCCCCGGGGGGGGGGGAVGGGVGRLSHCAAVGSASDSLDAPLVTDDPEIVTGSRLQSNHSPPRAAGFPLPSPPPLTVWLTCDLTSLNLSSGSLSTSTSISTNTI